MSINAVILAGGLATRLYDISENIPKAILNINGKPFITYQLDQLIRIGLHRVIIATGHLSDKIIQCLGHKYKNLELIYSYEKHPLGTGGAIAKANSLILSDTALIMNGDSYINTRLERFIKWHKNNNYDGSILVTDVKENNRYGNIKINKNGKIKNFSEKSIKFTGRNLINTGYYLLNKKLINDIPISTSKIVSLENDCFPFWLENGLGGFYRKAKFIDIGTINSFKEASKFFNNKHLIKK